MSFSFKLSNPDKCEVLWLTLKCQNIIQVMYKIRGQPVKPVSSAKYLGLTIYSKLGLTVYSKLNFSEHEHEHCQQCF